MALLFLPTLTQLLQRLTKMPCVQLYCRPPPLHGGRSSKAQERPKNGSQGKPGHQCRAAARDGRICRQGCAGLHV
ncbi:hypothetical protein PF005_g30016, partial [Phytophthora fragariae]